MIKKYFSRNYGFVTLAFFGISYIPIALYAFNAKALAFDYFLLSIPVLVAVLAITLGYTFTRVGSLVSHRFDRINEPIQNILTAVGLIVFLNDILVPTKATVLDGVSRKIPESVLSSSIEVVIAFSIFAVLVFGFKKRLTEKVMLSIAGFSIAFVMALLIFAGCTTVSSHKHSKDSVPVTSSTPITTQNTAKPNVYLIWLDAMQTEYFLKSVEQNNLSPALTGFTLFRNNSSNYLYTEQSYPSIFSGKIFKGGDYRAWLSDDRMRRLFKEHGYRITTYAEADFLSLLDDEHLSNQKIFEQATSARHPYFSDFFSLWMVRSAPNFLANNVFAAAKHISHKLDFFVNPESNGPRIATIDDGIEPFSGVKTLDKLAKDEFQRQGHGELVFAQALIPHGPFVIDSSCCYRGNDHSPALEDKYFDQVCCAVKKTIQFLNILKQLNRYDDSIIFIFGDHGSGWAAAPKGNPLNGKYTEWRKNQVLSRASALLMIKPSRASSFENFTVSAQETQLVDILPTILHWMQWKDDFSSYDGASIFSANSITREKILTYFAPAKYPDFSDAEIYKIAYGPQKGLNDLIYQSSFKKFFHRAPTIELDSGVDFSASGSSNDYIQQGWADQEETQRWTDDARAGIKLELRERPKTDLILRLDGSAFPAQGKYPQKIGVIVNGKKIVEWRMLDPAWYEASIPACLISDRTLNIFFEIGNPTAPCDVSSSLDCRKLGIAVKKIVIVAKK